MLFLWLSYPSFRADAQSTAPSTQSASPQASAPDDSATTATAGTEPTNVPSLDMTDEVIRDVLSNLQMGLQSRSLDQVLGVFDQTDGSSYARLRGQFQSFFRQYDQIRFRYQVLQAAVENGRGFATADVDMDASAADDAQVPLRRTLQMRFELKRGPKGWRVVAFKPSDVFAQ